MLLLMAFFIIFGLALGIFWICVFWFASLVVYLVAWGLSEFGFGVYIDISGENNIWLLFLLVIGLSCWIYSLEGSNIGFAAFVLLTGGFMLFRSSSVFQIGTS